MEKSRRKAYALLIPPSSGKGKHVAFIIALAVEIEQWPHTVSIPIRFGKENAAPLSYLAQEKPYNYDPRTYAGI
jgi:hypothetical protein